MLEGLLKWGVDYLLKDYVIIDPNAAKTNILEGKIEFENLELRPDLLEKVGVSGYSLKAGYIGKLHVHISPFNYSSQPANVVIDGIYLLVVPSHGKFNLLHWFQIVVTEISEKLRLQIDI